MKANEIIAAAVLVAIIAAAMSVTVAVTLAENPKARIAYCDGAFAMCAKQKLMPAEECLDAHGVR